LGLVIVVVADEVLDRVVREERLELAVELGRQGLVRRHHQGRLLHLLDDVGDGVGLARAGDAEQGLLGQAALEAGHELFDRLRLVAGGRIRRDQLEAVVLAGIRAGGVRSGHRTGQCIRYGLPNLAGCFPDIGGRTAPMGVVAPAGPRGPPTLRRPPMRPWTGFTLIEALIAMLLVALLLGVAVPAWTSASAATRSAAARAALEGTLIRGMRHATITGARVVVCPAATVGCRDTVDWSGGWIAWADLDGDRRRDPNETLLQRAPPLAGGVRLRSTTGRRRLVLQPHGGAAAGSNV